MEGRQWNEDANRSWRERTSHAQSSVDGLVERLRQQDPDRLADPEFEARLRSHLSRLSSRYARDINGTEVRGTIAKGSDTHEGKLRAHDPHMQDVEAHMNLLDEVRDKCQAGDYAGVLVKPIDLTAAVRRGRSSHGGAKSGSPSDRESPPTPDKGRLTKERRPPAFGSSLNLLALEESMDESNEESPKVIHEVTIAAKNRAKMLGRLSTCLGDLGLNISEAHAFCTTDGFTLDAFLVSGWEGTGDELQETIFRTAPEYLHAGDAKDGNVNANSTTNNNNRREAQASEEHEHEHEQQGSELAVGEEWEIDPAHLVVHEKIASGSFGDLYKGVFAGRDVAIKVLKVGQHKDQANLLREFMQELSVLRKVRHKHIVQLIGACTKPPKLCIVTEFMHGGSVLDYLHRNKDMPNRTLEIVRIAHGVALGMEYMHRCKIVHRDLKAANLLLDESGTVKVADFGVARVQSMSGVMTAETGTYRWMAPEVVAHQQYDYKCDIFSYGITLWELVTDGAVPYAGYTPLQAAVGVVQKGLRPTIPEECPRQLADAMRICWHHTVAERPTASELVSFMDKTIQELDPSANFISRPQGPPSPEPTRAGTPGPHHAQSYGPPGHSNVAHQEQPQPARPTAQRVGLLQQTLSRLGMGRPSGGGAGGQSRKS